MARVICPVVRGRSRTRTPMASASALPIAPATGPWASSPAPAARLAGGHHPHGHPGHLGEPQDRVAVPVHRGDPGPVEADPLAQRPAGALHRPALDLVAHPVRVDDLADVHGQPEPAQLRRGVRGHLGHRRAVAGRALVPGEGQPEPGALGPGRRRRPANSATSSMTRRARGSVRWASRNAAGSAPAAAASSSMNDSIANTLRNAPSERSDDVRIGMVEQPVPGRPRGPGCRSRAPRCGWRPSPRWAARPGRRGWACRPPRGTAPSSRGSPPVPGGRRTRCSTRPAARSGSGPPRPARPTAGPAWPGPTGPSRARPRGTTAPAPGGRAGAGPAAPRPAAASSEALCP